MKVLALRGFFGSLAAVALVGCGDPSLPKSAAFGEPFRVQNGQFFQGPLNAGDSALSVFSADPDPSQFPQGKAGVKLGKSVQHGAYAVAFRLQDLGTGYWVVPVSTEDQDPTTGNPYEWSATLDFSDDIPVGTHPLQVVAVDADGKFGPLYSPNDPKTITISSLIPDGDVVISLVWDTDADLDLHVLGPIEGGAKEYYSKQPAGISDSKVMSAADLPAGTGVLDRDSIASCLKDGFRREDAIWNWRPDSVKSPPQPGTPHGTYQIRVDMFDACNQAAANFRVIVYVGGNSVWERVGRLLNINADGGGAGSGLFVGEITFAF